MVDGGGVVDPSGFGFAGGVGVLLGSAPGGVVSGLVLLGTPFGVVVLGVTGAPGVPGPTCGVAVPAPGIGGPTCGVAVPAGGVAGAPGGVTVPAGGVAVPGVEVCPALDPPAGAFPLAGAACATAQLPMLRIANSNISFVFAIFSSFPAVQISLHHTAALYG